MIQKKLRCLLLLIAATALSAAAQTTTPQIRLNQIGFYPGLPKVAAVVDSPADEFYVVTADLEDTVFTGALGSAKTWTAAEETARLADFTELDAPGEYVLAVPDLGISYPFQIDANVHQELARAALKAYYYNRASARLRPVHAGKWARPAGHPDDAVLVHPSAASDGRPAGTIISAPRGWYDAGDYNKYVVNSGISTGTMLMLYEHYPGYFDALETNIPESGDDVPDLLDEILWNARWMLAMQDPGDGGVYHKLTTPNFEGAVMPNLATQQRYVVQKGTAAALDFAAVMAIGARVFDDFEDELPGLADSMRTSAVAAYDWALMNPSVPYDQGDMNAAHDPDVHTGEYGDNSFSDEFQWAAAELFITTGNTDYLPSVSGAISAPGWPSVGPLAIVSLSHHREDVAEVIDTSEVTDRLTTLANSYLNLKRESPFDIVMGNSGDFYWGSNSLAGNQSFMLLQAYRATGDERYLEAALANLDYLLGRNATGYSFVTGNGDRTPMNIHHRQSESDGINEPVPGFLAGGPNSGRQDGCNYPFTAPAKSYVDDWCSYASNEITINWNAPLLYVAGALEATLSPTGLPVSIEDRSEAIPEAPVKFEGFPNPAAGLAHFRLELDRSASVTLRAFDVLGREVARLVDGSTLSAGRHERSLDVAHFANGLYLLRVEAGERVLTHTFVVAN